MANGNNSEVRESVEKVCAEFDQRKEMLDEFCIRAKSLVEDCLKDAGIRFQSVQARVKKREKLQAKYLDPEKHYTKLDDITDQAALRVITYYDDELDLVIGVLKREFEVNPEQSVDKRETEPNKFGYRAVNLVCTHSEKRKSDVQFKKQANLSFEIQVTSVLGHAWSEIEHEWYDLKETYPAAIKRRFSRLAALFELAESEFVSLREQRTSYRRSVGVQVEAEVADVAIDAVSMKALIATEPAIAQLDKQISQVLGRPLAEATDRSDQVRANTAHAAGLTTVQALRDSLKKYEATIPEFVRRSLPIFRPVPSERPILKGISIYRLAMMLAAVQGEGTLIQFFQAAGFQSAAYDAQIGPLVTMSRELLAK